jgi:predicted O-methyltransferase YrrM
MRELEVRDAADRLDGTPQLQRLRQVPPETGRFIALIAASSPAGAMLEIGTSAGYSTLWLALAAAPGKRQVTTFEILPEKVRIAHETFKAAGVLDRVNLVGGDARQFLPSYDRIGFCFLDAEKGAYADCYELVVPRLCAGGWLLADNAINHAETLQPVIERAMSDPRVDAMVVPVGKGVLVCRRN